MNLYQYILENMNCYFNEKNASGWKNIYRKKLNNIEHDEPWLTLVSMYSMFDDQSNRNLNNRIQSFKALLSKSGFINSIIPTNVEKVLLEVKLPEIIDYRKYLYSSFEKEPFHLYPDRNKIIKERLKNQNKSLEGSTNLDLQIYFTEDEVKKVLFVEAKFMSDIDTKTTYNPVRNQIIRNIDAMIDFAMDERNEYTLEDVYFAMLTPKIFRTSEYGGGKYTLLNGLSPDRGRFYCYIMNEYRDFEKIKVDLPHRNLDDKEWKIIRDRIGWLTFEDIYKVVCNNNTMNSSYMNDFKEYFNNRNLI